MLRLFVVVAVLAVVGAAPAQGARQTCPGPGCAPIGSFALTLPAAGKVSFWHVTITGKAAKPPTVALAITGSGMPKGFQAAAFAPKPTVKSGALTATFYVSIANTGTRRVAEVAVAAGTTGFEAFGGDTQIADASVKQVTSMTCQAFGKIFNNDYSGLSTAALLWDNIWLDKSQQWTFFQVVTANLKQGGCRH